MSTIEAPPARAVDDWYRWPRPVDWSSYEQMLQVRGDRGVPRMIFLDGDLLLMTPSQSHEVLKVRLDRFVTEIVAGLMLDCLPTASTTWRREAGQCGVEGDLTYYLASTDRIRGKARIDLDVDPPPDLAVEVVDCHSASHALEVYRRLGVPEVWVATEKGLRILTRREGPEPAFEEAESSLGLPMLNAEEIADWIYRQAPDGRETLWLLELREWVARVLVPRRDGN